MWIIAKCRRSNFQFQIIPNSIISVTAPPQLVFEIRWWRFHSVLRIICTSKLLFLKRKRNIEVHFTLLWGETWSGLRGKILCRPCIWYLWLQSLFVNDLFVVAKQKGFLNEKIIKTEVGNEMKIFIKLTKYNTCQLREEGNPPAFGDNLVYFHPVTIV